MQVGLETPTHSCIESEHKGSALLHGRRRIVNRLPAVVGVTLLIIVQIHILGIKEHTGCEISAKVVVAELEALFQIRLTEMLATADRGPAHGVSAGLEYTPDR